MVIKNSTYFIHKLLTTNILEKCIIFFKFGLYLILLHKMYISASPVC
jgi:hypothetical protein